MKDNGRFRNWLAEFEEVEWRWALLAGFGVAIATTIVIGLIISLYAYYLSLTQGISNTDEIASFSELVGAYGSPIVHVILTGLAAYWVVRRVGTAVSWHGLCIGFFASVGAIGQTAIFIPDPITNFFGWNLLAFFPLPMLVGWIGANRGQATLAGQEKLYRASQAVQRAHTPQTIVNGIGQHLAGSQINHIGLWEILLQGSGRTPTAVSLTAAWSAKPEAVVQLGIQLTRENSPFLSNINPEEPLLLKEAKRSEREIAIWGKLGVRALLILPLVAADGNWMGLLTVGSKATSGLSRSNTKDYVTIGAQVTLVLDNMRLLQQARQTAVSAERQRLSRDIHDTLAQGFTSIVMHLEAAAQAMPHDSVKLQRHLAQAQQMARDSLSQARRVVDDLRPELLESKPLHEAIARVTSDWEQHTSISTSFQTTGTIQPLHPEIEVTLLRGTQEALSNIYKHAKATSASVTLSYMDDLVILDVQDDGIGFEVDGKSEIVSTKERGSFGLLGMRERIQQLSGEMLIESKTNDGTTVVLSIPTIDIKGIQTNDNF